MLQNSFGRQKHPAKDRNLRAAEVGKTSFSLHANTRWLAGSLACILAAHGHGAWGTERGAWKREEGKRVGLGSPGGRIFWFRHPLLSRSPFLAHALTKIHRVKGSRKKTNEDENQSWNQTL